jgi:hypothetical protein
VAVEAVEEDNHQVLRSLARLAGRSLVRHESGV